MIGVGDVYIEDLQTMSCSYRGTLLGERDSHTNMRLMKLGPNMHHIGTPGFQFLIDYNDDRLQELQEEDRLTHMDCIKHVFIALVAQMPYE